MHHRFARSGMAELSEATHHGEITVRSISGDKVLADELLKVGR